MKCADLHLHTIFSDGTYTPQQLISEAAKGGLSAIAVVDHDTIRGIQGAIDASETEGIEVLPGIELSAEYRGLEVHILGYLIDYKSEALRDTLDGLKKDRIERIYKIVDRLKGIGLGLEADTVFELAKQGTVGRLHVARALLKKGFTTSISEAFKKYIGDNCPGYVLGFKLSPSEAIKLIKDSGGIPVLAHPFVFNNDLLILEFINCGLMGLEVYYPEHTPAMVASYLNLAREHNLLVTGGSDFHGDTKPGLKVGSLKIPYELVEKLKAAKDNRL